MLQGWPNQDHKGDKCINILVRKIEKERDLSIDWMIILKSTFKKYYVKMWSGFIWLRIRSRIGLL
jgi:hypothetical protein